MPDSKTAPLVIAEKLNEQKNTSTALIVLGGFHGKPPEGEASRRINGLVPKAAEETLPMLRSFFADRGAFKDEAKKSWHADSGHQDDIYRRYKIPSHHGDKGLGRY